MTRAKGKAQAKVAPQSKREQAHNELFDAGWVMMHQGKNDRGFDFSVWAKGSKHLACVVYETGWEYFAGFQGADYLERMDAFAEVKRAEEPKEFFIVVAGKPQEIARHAPYLNEALELLTQLGGGYELRYGTLENHYYEVFTKTGVCETPHCQKPGTHLVSTSTYNETPPGYFVLCDEHAAEHNEHWKHCEPCIKVQQ